MTRIPSEADLLHLHRLAVGAARRGDAENGWRSLLMPGGADWPPSWPALPSPKDPRSLRKALLECAHRLLGPDPMVWKEAEFLAYLVGEYLDRVDPVEPSREAEAEERRYHWACEGYHALGRCPLAEPAPSAKLGEVRRRKRRRGRGASR